MRPGMDNTNCIVVEDAKAVAQDDGSRDMTSSQAPTEESLPTSTAGHPGQAGQSGQPGAAGPSNKSGNSEQALVAAQQPQQQGQQQLQRQEQAQAAAPRQLGPAVLEMRQLGTPHSATIPPFQFWNSEFRNKQPAFITLNFTLPWGANFAVYGRRNVAPSVTQYDFVKFVKSGHVDHRLKRSLSSAFSVGGDPLGMGEDLMQYQQSGVASAVSFTTSTTRKWRDHQVNPNGEILHVIPPPPFIVNHNHLEKIPHDLEETEIVSESLPSPLANTESDSDFVRNVSATDNGMKVSRNSKSNHKTDSSKIAKSNQSRKRSDPMKHHKISKRSSGGGIGNIASSMKNVSLVQYLDTGRWFLSVYNDDLRPHEVTMVLAEAEGISTACPNDCSGHGSCYMGKCDCIDGYEGIDCSKSVCPVLCSNHGKYGGGLCHCEEGWKGPECDIPEHDCQVPDCSGHGSCLSGVCVCAPGWKGASCEQVNCPDPDCSKHGACVEGKCYCKAGWQGVNCSVVDQQVYQCLPGCSKHGSYDLETGTCLCENYWAGPDCSQELCSLDCGPHGRCDKGRCDCASGWTGDRCDLLPCDARCSEHGQCKNGTCVCSQGWNGRHCTLPGCKSACNRHGTCALEDGEYHCVCSDGWAGADCSIRLEMECKDEIDNDEDGMVDCSDSECCLHPLCRESIMCLASNDPVEVLLRKQPPSVTASFYQRVKFLIEENSVQSYAHMDEYSESRVSVMRGQVVTPQGLGIIGIRVSVDRESKFGFTLTRAGGWFDVLVNGGGAVTLQFQRSPFQPLTKTVFVPWNQIVVLPPITMQLSEDSDVYNENSGTNSFSLGVPGASMPLFSSNSHHAPCMDHDHEQVRPVIMSTWMPEKVGGIPGKSIVFAETQILQESIRIPGSMLHLMYQSSQAPGYLSRVLMRLTHATIPPTLTHVHVRVEIEGSVHTRTYEADPRLTHTFAWNKRNVYKQKVYGVAQARISVGYQYSTCPAIVWETQTAMLQGFDVDISDVGGWSLDIHHHYNFHEGILQKGDGSTLHFKQYPRTVKVVMGTGLQRPLICNDCNGAAKDSRLLTPVALTSGPDGSLYVGDFNLVRRVTPDGKVYTVLQLSATQVSYQYYLSVSPADGHLYIANPEKHQILRVLSLDPVEEPAINCEPVVGSGERCIPGDETHCGDEGPASEAKLAHPKGLAIAADKTMFIADGTNIRAVDPKGIIHTLVGHHGHYNHWSPVPCHGAIPAQQAQLQWPTGLSLSPLDGSLHFIDDRLVLKLTDDLKVKVVAGTPLHCHATSSENHQHPKSNNNHENENSNPEESDRVEIEESTKATRTVLGSVLALAFSPAGDLYIAESDSRKVNSIRVVDSAGRISDFAGRQQGKLSRLVPCDCNNNFNTSGPGMSSACPCASIVDDSNSEHSSKETMLSSNAQFTSISALTVSPDGVLNVADQGSLHILALEHYLPTHDENGEFRIPYPPTREIYVFNRYGQHIATKDLTSGKTRYSFLYSKNTSFGKLSTVTDSSGNKILFLRDYSNVVSTIENTQDHKSDLKISGVGFLVKFSEKGKSEIELEYDSSTGLLTSRSDSRGGGGGETYIYHYEANGRLTDVILSTGETVSLASHLTPDDGLAVEVSSAVQSVVAADTLPAPAGAAPAAAAAAAGTAPAQPHAVSLKMEGRGAKRLIIKEGAAVSEAASFANGSLTLRWAHGGALHAAALARHPLLELALPVEAQMLPMWSQQTLALGDGLLNAMQWSYTLVGDVGAREQTLQRELWVNNSRVLGIEFDQASGRETFYDRDRQALLAVTFDAAGLPQSWIPANGGQAVNISYDRFNRVDGWQWGIQSEKYSYENHGLLSEISSPLDGSTKFTYNELNMLLHITLPSQRRFTLQYDEDGGLRHVSLPSNTKHSFSCQPSLGFLRVTYTPPGSLRSYIQHYSHSGALLQTVFPGDGARVIYRYHSSGQLAEVLHGDGRSQINYNPLTGFPNEVIHTEQDFEYKWDYQYTSGLLTEERLDFGAKTGLSNAKFIYEYDSNFRLTNVQGRIGGQNLPEHSLEYNSKTGAPKQIGQFKISHPHPNETTVYDGTAIFSRLSNSQFQEVQVAVTIHGVEVIRMEFTYDSRSRISQTRTYTRNMGANTYTNEKNYTWDSDGQLSGIEAQEPWGFKYDPNGNMLSLTYKGNTIPMEYNVMDRIVKVQDGLYRYDNRGLVVQNAREEKFHYNAKGLLVRATKRGRFDVRYYYDHLDRLATRKDNYGNVTQFFYTNHQHPNEVSQIYRQRDGKLMSLVYDDRGHLIYAKVYRNKYYVATDQCGTPIMVFNQYGEGIREIMRSPYGHIVYDSNPYLYLPVDFCGGLLDQVTSLVHMPNGKVYDPLIGQWMSPMWEGVLDRVANPTHLHLYRFNGNDPINVRKNLKHLTDHQSWLSLLGYDLQSLAPQLYPENLPVGGIPSSMMSGGSIGQARGVPGQNVLSISMPQLMLSRSSIQLEYSSSVPAFSVASGFISHLAERRLGDASTLSSPPRSAVKKDMWPPNNYPATNPASVFPFRRLGSASDPPFGRGIVVSRTLDGRAVVSSVPAANSIYRDVFTSVFNQSYLLPFTFLVHNAQQDAFYFVKEDTWRATEDRTQLKRLGGSVNVTYHEKEAGSSESNGGNGKVADLKIHGTSAVVNLRYGTTPEKEKQRLLHHAKGVAVRKAWHREREALRNSFAGSVDWSATEIDEILKVGTASSYDGEYIHDVQRYPELAEDPFNIRFIKKTSSANDSNKRRRKKRGIGHKSDSDTLKSIYSRILTQSQKLKDSLLSNFTEDLLESSSGPYKVHSRRTCANKKHWWLPWVHRSPAC